MNNTGDIINVPGKVMIAGEYAVLEPGYLAVVIAVNRYITVEIEPSLVNELSLSQLELENVTWDFCKREVHFLIEDDRLCFVKNAMDIAFHYLLEKGIPIQSFRLNIKSDLNCPTTGKKYGLGSSAAIVVAVITSIVSLHEEFHNESDLMNLFKLSVIAHVKTQGNGSGADIAASVYGGWIEYKTFNSKWLLREIEKDSSIMHLLNTQWPGLSIRRLSPPDGLTLLVGWTQESAGTVPMVKKIEEYKEKNPENYQVFLKESLDSVTQLIEAFETGDVKKSLDALHNNRKALLGLGELAEVIIETKRLKTLCTIANQYGRAKSSGAGGGDCGIAFVEDKAKQKELWLEWKKAGIVPLDIVVAPNGCTVIRK